MFNICDICDAKYMMSMKTMLIMCEIVWKIYDANFDVRLELCEVQ